MLSTDLSFYLCAAAIFILFYSARSALLQTTILTVGSFGIYATEGLFFLLLLFGSTALTSVCSFWAAQSKSRYSTAALVAGVAINLLVLALFKYKQLLPPLSSEWNTSWLHNFLALSLPIGISFYTFHGISLVVDAWRTPEVLRHRNSFSKHFADTGLYLAFFPQLVAGPISKGKWFFPQIAAKRLNDIQWSQATSMIIVGMFLKRVVADNLNQFTIPLTDSRLYPITPQSELVAMMIGYSAQIFADFAGYSLIAIGVGLLFGYRLPDNFNRPYIAQSITDFWRRWHMSLSSWLKEYVYIPLGGNRLSTTRTYVNLLLVMGFGGLWHGADWKFAVWGLWHGGLLALERLLGLGGPTRGPVALFRILITFSLVTFGWLFFRLTHLEDAWLLIREFAADWRPTHSRYMSPQNVMCIYLLSAIVLLFHIPFMEIAELNRTKALIVKLKPYGLGVLVTLILTSSGSRHGFIYFQF